MHIKTKSIKDIKHWLEDIFSLFDAATRSMQEEDMFSETHHKINSYLHIVFIKLKKANIQDS